MTASAKPLALPPAILPPYAQSLDMTVDGLVDGAPKIVMPFAQKVQGRPGFVHGGAISGLLEMAAVAAIAYALRERGDDARFKQVNVTVDFMRGGTMQTSYAVGTITRMGRTMANVEARAWQDDPERPIAMAYLHYLLKRGVTLPPPACERGGSKSRGGSGAL